MRIIRGSEIEYVAASHEDPKNPGSLKKVLVRRDDLLDGQVQMINWAKLPVGKAFEAHYHEDMEEVFVIMRGKVEIVCGGKQSMQSKQGMQGRLGGGKLEARMDKSETNFKFEIPNNKQNKDSAMLGAGDAVIIEVGEVHVMRNVGEEDVEYIALGVSREGKGRTVVVGSGVTGR